MTKGVPPMRIVPIPSTKCPSCGAPVDVATPISNLRDDKFPKPGALGMCVNVECLEILVLNENLSLRVQTPDEYMNLPLKTRRMIILAREVLSRTRKKK